MILFWLLIAAFAMGFVLAYLGSHNEIGYWHDKYRDCQKRLFECARDLAEARRMLHGKPEDRF